MQGCFLCEILSTVSGAQTLSSSCFYPLSHVSSSPWGRSCHTVRLMQGVELRSNISQPLPVRFLVWSRLPFPLLRRVTGTPQTLLSTSDTCHHGDTLVLCQRPLVGGSETVLLTHGVRISYINVQMQRTPCPEVLSEWWEFGPPVMNGPRVILIGAMNNAPSLRMSLCWPVLFFPLHNRRCISQ